MPPTLPLSTDRLLIEPMTPGDAEAFAAYRSDPGVARFQSWEAPFPLDATRRLLAENPPGWPAPGEWAQLAVRVDGDLAGDVAVHPLDDAVRPDTVEIGITLAPAHQGRGIATEAIAAVAAAALAAGAHRLIAESDARNTAVAALLRRVGFRHEGRLIDAERWKGEWTSTDLWGLLPGDLRTA